MKKLTARKVLVCVAALGAMSFSASAQLVPTAAFEPPMGPAAGPDTTSNPPPGDQGKKTTISPAVTDAWPEKRNPFWPLDLRKQPVTTTTNVTSVAAPAEAKEVDWNRAAKFLKENKKLSSFAGKILVAFNGRIYDIGSLVEVPFEGNIYTFKVVEGGELTQQTVRPAEN